MDVVDDVYWFVKEWSDMIYFVLLVVVLRIMMVYGVEGCN